MTGRVPAGRDDRVWVVVVPGLGLDAREWAGVWPGVPGSSTVVALPTMGRPTGRRRSPTVEELAGHLLELLPGRGPLVLVGHSASCQVVAEAAAREPRVAWLVLVGPTTDPAARGWPRTVGRWVRTARHERLWEVAALTPQYTRTGIVSMLRGMNRFRRHRLEVALAATAARVVVVRGEHDHIAPQRWCRRLAEAAAGGGEVRTVPAGAHMLPLTHPVAVAEAVADAVTSVGGGLTDR